jgi:enamine deaminase RidA (YjgF/YER057c/UK114 family)
MNPQFIDPSELSVSPNYSQVVVVPSGRTVHVSGQVALDSTGSVVGAGNLHAQAMQVFENLHAALAAAGASFSNLVKVTVYVVDLNPDKAKVVREVRAQYLPPGHKPASTMVGVTALVHPELLLEVEAIAALSERR